MDTSLAGKLLVATPDLTDDLFARSVVLVLQHDDETAEGVILKPSARHPGRRRPARLAVGCQRAAAGLPGWPRPAGLSHRHRRAAG